MPDEQLTSLSGIIQSLDTYDTDTDIDYVSDLDYDTDDSYALTAQEQWEESLRQINGLVNLLVFPLLGKMLGRRFSHMLWRRVADWWYI